MRNTVRKALCLMMCLGLAVGTAGCKKKPTLWGDDEIVTENRTASSYTFNVTTGDVVQVALADGSDAVLAGDREGFAVMEDDVVLAKGDFLSKIVANNKQAQFAPDESYSCEDDGTFSFEALNEQNKRQYVIIKPLEAEGTLVQLVSDNSMDDAKKALDMLVITSKLS